MTVHTLLVSCLRMRPDRILLAELRKDEAYFYLEAISSGHPGAITSVHANSARLVFERVISMVREGPGGANLAGEDIRRFLHAAGRRDRPVQEGGARRWQHGAPGGGNLV